jgi:hypothetical protein
MPDVTKLRWLLIGLRGTNPALVLKMHSLLSLVIVSLLSVVFASPGAVQFGLVKHDNDQGITRNYRYTRKNGLPGSLRKSTFVKIAKNRPSADENDRVVTDKDDESRTSPTEEPDRPVSPNTETDEFVDTTDSEHKSPRVSDKEEKPKPESPPKPRPAEYRPVQLQHEGEDPANALIRMWSTGMVEPQDIMLKTEHDQIRALDFFYLLHPDSEPITDSVMNSYVRMMLASQAANVSNVYYIEPSVWKLYREIYAPRRYGVFGDNPKMTKEDQETFEKVFQDHDMVLAIHHEGYHWFVILYVKYQNILYVLDSLARKLNYWKLEAIAEQFYDVFRPVYPGMGRKLTVKKLYVPQQSQLDCGVFAVMTVERIRRGLDLEDYDVNIKKARRHVATTLLSGEYSLFEFDQKTKDDLEQNHIDESRSPTPPQADKVSEFEEEGNKGDEGTNEGDQGDAETKEYGEPSIGTKVPRSAYGLTKAEKVAALKAKSSKPSMWKRITGTQRKY